MILSILKNIASILLTIGLLFVCSFVRAQTEPYYQLPEERTEKGGKTFPNLKASAIKLYIRPEGSLLLQGNSLNDNLNGQLTQDKQTLTNWGAAFGYNFKDHWMAEVGYLQTPLFLPSILKISPYLIPLSPSKLLHTIPVRFQRKTWTLDRVSRTTSLFLGGGIALPINAKSGEIFNKKEAFLQPTFSRNPPDTIRINNVVSLKKMPIYAQVFAELRGKVVEELEIGVFVNYQTTFTKIYQSEIKVQRNSSPPLTALQILNSSGLRFGLSIHYNFGIITNYESDIK